MMRPWRSALHQTRLTWLTRRPIVRSVRHVPQPAVTPTVWRVCRSVHTCLTRGNNPLPVTIIPTTPGDRTCTWSNITNTGTDTTVLGTKDLPSWRTNPRLSTP